MKTIKIFFVLIMMASMILTACGAPATEPPAEEPAAEEPAAEEPAAEEPAEGEVVTLAYWSMWNEPETIAQVIQGWIDEFEAQNPNIKIEPVWNGRENQTKARTALAGGTVIDIVDQDADQIAGGMMTEGLGYPLNEFLDQKALDEDVPIKDVFYPGLLEVFEQDGNIYLWPYMNSVVMWWYNKDIFEEAGVTPPETWEQFIENGEKIRDAGYGVMAVEGDVFDYNMFLYAYYLARVKGKGFLLSAITDETGVIDDSEVRTYASYEEVDADWSGKPKVLAMALAFFSQLPRPVSFAVGFRDAVAEPDVTTSLARLALLGDWYAFGFTSETRDNQDVEDAGVAPPDAPVAPIRSLSTQGRLSRKSTPRMAFQSCTPPRLNPYNSASGKSKSPRNSLGS